MKIAFKCHTLHLAIVKEKGDWEEKGNAYGNLGHAYMSLGDFNKTVGVREPWNRRSVVRGPRQGGQVPQRHLAIAQEVGDRRGVREPLKRVSFARGLWQCGQAAHAAHCDRKGVGRPCGGGSGVIEPRDSVLLACCLLLGDGVRKAAPGDLKGVERPGSRGQGIREPRRLAHASWRVRQRSRLLCEGTMLWQHTSGCRTCSLTQRLDWEWTCG